MSELAPGLHGFLAGHGKSDNSCRSSPTGGSMQEPVHGRADYRDPAGERGRGETGRADTPPWDLARDVLQVAPQVRRAQGRGGEAPARARGREPPNERRSMDFVSDTVAMGPPFGPLRSSTIAPARHPASWSMSRSAPSESPIFSRRSRCYRGPRVRQPPRGGSRQWNVRRGATPTV